MRTFTRPAAVGAAALLLVGLSGCSAIFGAGEPERDAETGEITEASDADVFAIRVGDCLESAEMGTEVSSLPTVPCDQPHDSEAYASTMLDDGEFPGLDEVGTVANDYCLEEFATFVGTDYYDSELEMSTLSPSEDTWTTLDDREVLCLVLDMEGGVTGSLKGAQR
ncbi:septum formation family protein [Actinotalea sp. C106]|uniref:septum formation family protein n=1 Tax=Actinotalea sp. C106 TaxID=2908644 RepID=UPI0020282A06|nr:septum formation family protein [Actinotalea sp. C106]